MFIKRQSMNQNHQRYLSVIFHITYNHSILRGKNGIYRNSYSLAKFSAMQNNPLL